MTPTQVSDTLHQFVTDRQNALKNGLRDRERIKKMVDAGETPFGYRVDWIVKTAHLINDTLIQSAGEFNERYPGDLISTSDLMDALATMMNMLKLAAKESK